jgi:hypothetical protein
MRVCPSGYNEAAARPRRDDLPDNTSDDIVRAAVDAVKPFNHAGESGYLPLRGPGRMPITSAEV